jgi:hypothetical protein
MARKAQPNANKKTLDSQANVLRLSNVNGDDACDTQQGSPKMSNTTNYVFYPEVIVLEISSEHGNCTLYLDPWDNKIESFMAYLELVRGTQINLFHMMCLGWDLRRIYKAIQDPNFSYRVYSHDPEHKSYYLEDLYYEENDIGD